MEDSWENFLLICKPEQSGKTFLMIQQIIKDLEECKEKLVINFIFCDNNLLLTKQTSERVGKDIVRIDGISYVEFSSRGDEKTKRNSDEVITSIVIEDIRNIICCTNSKRVSDVVSIIKDLISSPHLRDFNFKVWLDEADKFIKFIDNSFYPLSQRYTNIFFYCLTATPQLLFKRYKYMSVLPLEKTTDVHYHGWKDNDIVIMNSESKKLDHFIKHVMKNVGNPEKGTKWFVPAEKKKVSHSVTREILSSNGFAVFVVNGDGISLTLPHRDDICCMEDKQESLNIQIDNMCKKYDLKDTPLAVTGNICIGRGISIMSPNFIFDYGILFPCSNKSEASQIAGRLKGNIKNWENYKKPIIYTTKKFDRIATEWEQKSRNLATLAFEKENEKPVTITQTEFKKLGKNAQDPDFDSETFDTDQIAIDWIEENFGLKKAPSGMAPKALRDKETGENPTEKYILERKWGLGGKNTIRKIRLRDDRVCVYWRPSHFPGLNIRKKQG